MNFCGIDLIAARTFQSISLGRTLSFGAILLRPRNLAQTMPRLILATRRLDLIHMRWPLYGFGASLSSRGHQAGVCGAGAFFNPAQTMFAQ